MEDFGFDIGGLLSEEEANKLFEKQAEETTKDTSTEETETKETEKEPAEEEETSTPEEVGEEENENGSSAINSESDGSSPNIYSSIASALKNDGIFPDFDDDELTAVTTPEAFAELFEKAIEAKLDEKQKRIDEALGNGVQPDTVKNYEQTLQYLNSINEEALSAETDEGENLRKQIIYNDLIARGYSQEKAMKELEKSFKAGSDVDDAKDALQSLTDSYAASYKQVQEQAKKQKEDYKAQQQQSIENFKKMVFEDDLKFGDAELDKRTRQQVYDAVMKPVYKDPASGQLLTAFQKYMRENPLEYYKQMGLWYVMTNGGKNLENIAKTAGKTEKVKAIKDLERKINSSSLNKDGSLRYVSSGMGDKDPLLSDGWKVGW